MSKQEKNLVGGIEIMLIDQVTCREMKRKKFHDTFIDRFDYFVLKKKLYQKVT